MSSDVRTIGPGWSDDPVERAQQIAAQQRLVSFIANAIDHTTEDQLEAYAETQRRQDTTRDTP